MFQLKVQCGLHNSTPLAEPFSIFLEAAIMSEAGDASHQDLSRMEGWKDGRKEGRKDGRKRGGMNVIGCI